MHDNKNEDHKVLEKKFKVSVITVVFNSGETLQHTIDSVLLQDFTNIEYVVIDGSSTDCTIDIIKHNASNIDRWISEPDKGIYDAMNKGIQLATGDFVIFMNAGDRFYNSSAISSCMHDIDDSDVIYGDHWTVGSRRNNGHHKAKPISKLPFGMICSHQSMFFKRETLLKNLFSLTYGTAGDYECICRLYANGAKFHKCQETIISYYLGGGVSDINRFQSIKNTFLAAKKNNILTGISILNFTKEAILAIAKKALFK